jgi:ribosomal protein L11 methylase PrmA
MDDQQRRRAILRQRMQAKQSQAPPTPPVVYTPHQKKVLDALRAQLAALHKKQRELKLLAQDRACKFWINPENADSDRFEPRHTAGLEEVNFDIELAGAFPELTYCPLREFNYRQAGTLAFQQDVSDVGGTVWDASIILGHYFDDLGLSQMTGARVLELGAGTGVPGIVAARLHAERVVFTDLKSVLPITEQIVTSHIEAASTWCKVEFQELIWGTPLGKLPWVSAAEPFDIIVGADVLYRDLDDLFDSVVSLMAPNTVLFMAYERRHTTREASFFAKFDDSWECEILSSPMLDHCTAIANVCIHRIRRRK